MRSRIRTRHVSLVAAYLACTLVLPGFAAPASAQSAERPTRVANILVFSTATRTPLITALGTDAELINMTVITSETLAPMSLDAFNHSLAQADVMFVDRFLPDDINYLRLLVSHVNGTLGYDGLVMFGILQNGSAPGEGDLTPSQVSAIAPILPVDLPTDYVNSTGNSSAPGYVIGVEPAPGVPDNSTILVDCIPWGSCPLVDRRVMVTAKPGAALVLTDQTGAETVLAEWFISDNDSSVMFFSMEITDHNFLFTGFPYFAYFMYVCTFHAMYNYSDALIESWEEWPFSTGPGGDVPWALLAAIAALVGVAFWIYLKTRKKGAGDPGRGKAAIASVPGSEEPPGDAEERPSGGVSGAVDDDVDGDSTG